MATKTGAGSIFEADLAQNRANTAPLTPVSFLRRAAAVYPDKLAIVHGDARYSYRQFHARACRLASALSKRGIGIGDTVAIIAPNVPALLESHFAVPMLGAILNPLNVRSDAATAAFILEHGQAKVLITDREFSATMKPALAQMKAPPLVIDIDDALAAGGELLGDLDYEAFLAEGDPEFQGPDLADEWRAIGLLYTSGTTGDPKGVVYHHRGAYLNALGDVVSFGLTQDTNYLWTLPMFHCSGWSYTWAVTAACGTHICLRKVDPALVFPMIKEHRVTHMCGAPIVLNMLINAPDEVKTACANEVAIMTGGAAPPSAVIEGMEALGFRVVHAYGLTETYGPATYCAWHEDWSKLSLAERSEKMARQGVRYVTTEDIMIADPETVMEQPQELPWDGVSMGEIMLRGNTVMKGYLKNPAATAAAFKGGWFHSGDLAVRHPDGYVEVKDRSKDIIISGGENISSLELEEVLYRHPKVLEAAVVAKPDETWGETPCAFVALKNGAETSSEEIIEFCRANIAHYKVPKYIVFGPLPKTSTGKIQKFLLREQANAL